MPVRETGHVRWPSTDSPGAALGARVRGSSMRAEPFKMMKGVTTLPIEHDTGLAGASTLVAPTIRCGLPK
jgi:hypothetical protein